MTKLQDCELCPRLTAFRRAQKSRFPAYHCRPVAAFGDRDAPLLIVGLAPGLHGANATGRPFTGDAAGDLLFEILYKFGFANQSRSRGLCDDLQLIGCRITNAVKCLPPNNRPTTDESRRCNPYLRQEIEAMPPGAVILALGVIAHQSVLRALDIPQSQLRFNHLAEYSLNHEGNKNGLQLIDSYHCSRYNINTKRLTPTMFEQVFVRIRELIL